MLCCYGKESCLSKETEYLMSFVFLVIVTKMGNYKKVTNFVFVSKYLRRTCLFIRNFDDFFLSGLRKIILCFFLDEFIFGVAL